MQLSKKSSALFKRSSPFEELDRACGLTYMYVLCNSVRQNIFEQSHSPLTETRKQIAHLGRLVLNNCP